MYTDWPDCNDPRQMRAQSLTSEKKGAEALWRQEKRHRARPSSTTLPRLPFLDCPSSSFNRPIRKETQPWPLAHVPTRASSLYVGSVSVLVDLISSMVDTRPRLSASGLREDWEAGDQR